jgi:hypothetical protein
LTELRLSKTLIDKGTYTEAIKKTGEENTLRKLQALKTWIGKFSFGKKREKCIKLAPAVVAVMLVAGILSGLIIVNVSSLYQASSTISSVGTFKAVGIGVYWDEEATRSVEAFDWGSMLPGAEKSFTVYIRNEGVLPLTLSVSTSNWNPTEAADYLTLTCSHSGQTIDTQITVPVTVTLTVSSDIMEINTFAFDITAVGTYDN